MKCDVICVQASDAESDAENVDPDETGDHNAEQAKEPEPEPAAKRRKFGKLQRTK
jgi:hypothetical protein